MTKKISAICFTALIIMLVSCDNKAAKPKPKPDYYEEVYNAPSAEQPAKHNLKGSVKTNAQTIKNKVEDTAISLINAFAREQNSKFPPEVLENLKNGLLKLGQDYDTEMKKTWFNEQATAYLKLADIKKSLNFDEMKVFNASETQAKGNYVNQLDYFEINKQSYETYNSIRKSATPTERKLIDDVFKKFNITDYRQMANDYDRWRAFFSSRNSIKTDNDAVFNEMQQTAISRSQGDANKALEELDSLCNKYTQLKEYKILDVVDEKIERIKKQLQEKYPNDFEKQLEELKKMPPEAFNKVELKYDLGKILFKYDFGNGKSSLAILCKIGNTPVIIGDKYLIPDSLPVSFDNSVCSLKSNKIIVNKKYKVVGFIIDNLPDNFGAIPSVDDAKSIGESNVFSLILNNASGINVFPSKFNIMDTNRLFDVRILRAGISYMIDGTSTRAYDNRNYVFRNNYVFSLDNTRSTNRQLWTSNAVLANENDGEIAAFSIYPPLPKITQALFNDSLNSIIGDPKLKASPFSDDEASAFFETAGYDHFIPVKFLSLQTLKNTEWQTLNLDEYYKQQAEYRIVCKYNNDLLVTILSRCKRGVCETGLFAQGYEKLMSSLPNTKGNPKAVESKVRAFLIYVYQKARYTEKSLSYYENYYSVIREDFLHQLKINKYLTNYFKEQMIDRNTSILNEVRSDYVRYSKTLR